MKLFSADFDVVILRYFLMMSIAVVAFFSGLPWLAILCLPTFLMAMLAVRFDFKKNRAMSGKNINPYQKSRIEEAA